MNKYENYTFDFEKLEVYKKALKFIRNVFKVNNKLVRDYRFSIGDQFTRAALSIANNIAEGSGKQTKKAKAQFYKIALNSLRECIPMITLLYLEKQLSEETYVNLRSDCVYIGNMIGKLIKSLT